MTIIFSSFYFNSLYTSIKCTNNVAWITQQFQWRELTGYGLDIQIAQGSIITLSRLDIAYMA